MSLEAIKLNANSLLLGKELDTGSADASFDSFEGVTEGEWDLRHEVCDCEEEESTNGGSARNKDSACGFGPARRLPYDNSSKLHPLVEATETYKAGTKDAIRG